MESSKALGKVALRPDYAISRLIKGGWQLSGDHGPVDAARAIADMIGFVDQGVTAFDCADIYAGVEEKIGRFRAALADQRGSERAAAIKIHTKYVPDRGNLAGLSPAQIEAAIDRSLARLGMERLDLVQLHWWDYAAPGLEDAAGHLERLRQKGKIHLIGLTNFDAAHLGRLSAVADIAAAQVQFSLLDQRATGPFADLAREKGVSLFSYGVLAGGFLSETWLGRQDPGFAFENRSLVKYRLIIEEFGGWRLFQDLLRALNSIASRQGADLSTIAIRWVLEADEIAAPIVGARYANRLSPTLRAFDIALTAEDRAEIAAVLTRRKGPDGPVYGLERDIDGAHGRIMKYNLNKGDDRLALEDER